MKRFTILAGLTLTLLAFSSAQAQSYEDVIIAFNEATELAQQGSHTEAIAAFERVITISDQVGTEADEIKTRAQKSAADPAFSDSPRFVLIAATA